MIRKLFLAAAMLQLTINPVSAQTLTVEELRAQIDARVEQMNPYAELLNDPDPERSMAAMQIMLESGDDVLKDMALEFGLLSPNPSVRRTAFEAYLATGPNLTVQVDGSAISNASLYTSRIEDLGGTVGADNAGFFRLPTGAFDAEKSCYTSKSEDNCLIVSNGDGVFLSYRIGCCASGNGRGVLVEDGTIKGTLSLEDIEAVLPFVVQVIR
ncbi:hypothetical protein KDD17_02645 [Sulfitobacter albidus]|uniref:Uncharacterized protein n=1 Tax=Sulfitobacter albidus TaxID=2829501 RepID=A0A975PMM6_9RHOB|nr:hypothetical protein [Sulfitobacter albidus]QUJ76968.1 hypothetical protein KDD17_02645 [Sulfitobacter albidus]